MTVKKSAKKRASPKKTAKKVARPKQAAKPHTPAKKRSASRRAPAKSLVKKTGRRAGTPEQGSLLGNDVQSPAGDILDAQLLMPQKVVANAFGVSVQALQRWPVKPRMVRGREKLYYLPDVIDFRLNRDDPDELNLGTERARLAAAQADRTELEVAQLKGILIPADMILENWEPIVGAARAKVLAIAPRVKAAIPKLNDRDIAKIKKICRGTLEDLANGGIPKRAKVDTRKGL